MTNPPRQLGWTTGDGFHEMEFTKRVRKMSPTLTPTLRKTSLKAVKLDAMHDFADNWNSAINKLYGAPDAELYRLILAMGFRGTYSCTFRSEVTGVVNIYLKILVSVKPLTKVIAGIFGQSPDPFVLQAQHGTIRTAFFEIISYVNSLPLTLDETGQMDTDSLMAFVHTCTRTS